MRKLLIPTLFLIPVLLTTGCNKQSSGSDIKVNYTLSLNETNLSLFEDESFILVATTNAGGNVSFSSSDTSVASVSSSGRVIAKNEGSAVITASVGELTATCNVVVEPITNKNEDYIRCEQAEYVVALQDKTQQYIVASYYVNNEIDSSKEIRFLCNDDEIATVNSNGTIIPHKEGTVTVDVYSGDISTTVFIDVYTINIKTVNDWNTMLGTLDNKDARFILSNDLNFAGREYRHKSGYNANWTKCHYLMGTLEGGYHTVSNITFTDVNDQQAIFGFATAFILRNIEFKNIKFTSTQGNGGLFTSLMHHVTEDGVNNIYTTLISNVICDFTYSTIGGSAIANAFYGGGIENVFVSMKDSNNNPLTPNKSWAISKETYLWWDPNFITNVICYVDNGDVSIGPKMEGAGIKLSYDLVYKTNSLIEANYIANENFDTNIWDIKPNEVPTFK